MAYRVHVFQTGLTLHGIIGEVPGDSVQEAVNAVAARLAETGGGSGIDYHIDGTPLYRFMVEGENRHLKEITPSASGPSGPDTPDGLVDSKRLNEMWGIGEENDNADSD